MDYEDLMADVEEVQEEQMQRIQLEKNCPASILKDFAGKKQCKPMKESQCSLPGVKGI